MMKSAQWIDAHCHLASDSFLLSLPEVIRRSQLAGVTGWIQGGIDPKDWARQQLLKTQYGPRFLTSFGLHPWWVATASLEMIDSALLTLETLLPEAAALGELGLDFGKTHDLNREEQINAFKRQLEIGKRASKPLVLHIVKAHSEALEILKCFGPFPAGGIIHSFTGPYEIAEEYFKLGFFVSLGGAVTQTGYFALKKAIPLLSLSQIVVETDSPDQVPKVEGIDPKGVNEPQFLVAIAKAIAQIKGVTVQAVLSQSTENLERLFGI
ncbi:MAG: TatD family deoxyribonuclease [Bdellovibrionales bacterium]|nr:TatD family deoxyribonuclease [Bdellovibrionales bacterium]